MQRLRSALLAMKKTVGMMSQEAEREVRVLEHLKHPSIVRVHEHFVDPVGQNLCIVMDYAAGGDLQHFLDRRKAADAPRTDKQVLGVLVQLLGAVAHCHQRSVLHRDIKPSNIFVTTTSAAEATRRRTLQTRLIHPPSSGGGEGSQSGGLPRPDHSQEGEDLIIFLGDFGISRELDTEKALAQTITGTPYYLAPEIIRGEGYGIKSDIWAVRARRNSARNAAQFTLTRSIHLRGHRAVPAARAPNPIQSVVAPRARPRITEEAAAFSGVRDAQLAQAVRMTLGAARP